MIPAFLNGYLSALSSLGCDKYASWREGLNRVFGGAATGGVVGALKGLGHPSSEGYSMSDVGRLAGIGALGGAGLGAAAQGFKSSDPASMPVRVGIGGALGGGIGAGIPYLLGIRDPAQLKRLALMGAGGGAGVGLFASMLNPRVKDKEIPLDEIDDTRDLAVEDPEDLPPEWWKK